MTRLHSSLFTLTLAFAFAFNSLAHVPLAAQETEETTLEETTTDEAAETTTNEAAGATEDEVAETSEDEVAETTEEEAAENSATSERLERINAARERRTISAPSSVNPVTTGGAAKPAASSTRSSTTSRPIAPSGSSSPSARSAISSRSTPSRTATPRTATPRAPLAPTRTPVSPASSESRDATRRTGANANDAAGNGDEEETTDRSAREAAASGQGFTGWVRSNATWILSILGAGLLAVVLWLFLGSRSSKKKLRVEPAEEALDRGDGVRPARGGQRFSSTRISAKDVEARLSSSSVRGDTVETNREYALVVDREALRDLTPETHPVTGREFADEAEIRRALDASDPEAAFQAYLFEIERDGARCFHADTECRLSEQLILREEYLKAARVLEHHVATQATAEIEPEAYFQLGYVHFKNRTLPKAKRFFELFARSSRDPEHTRRAERVLESLKAMN